MELFDTTQIALSKAMEGASMAQQAISQNIANADTPGYRRVKVDFQDALRDALHTDEPLAAVDGLSFSEKTDAAAPVQADGNSVDISTESAAEAMNGLTYQALTSVSAARVSILQYAMGVK